MGIVTVGADIGQSHDPTAIAVAEITDAGRYEIRFLERMPLGTAYPDVARRLAEVSKGVHNHSGGHPKVLVDATGVGKPVVDIIHETGVPFVIPVFFTHGDRLTEREDGSYVLGKAFMVARLQILLQEDRLIFPRNSPEARPLTDELLDYEIRVTAKANDTYGAFRTGAYDDLVTAVGLSVIALPTRGPLPPVGSRWLTGSRPQVRDAPAPSVHETVRQRRERSYRSQKDDQRKVTRERHRLERQKQGRKGRPRVARGRS